jgi:serine/threonine protein kinase
MSEQKPDALIGKILKGEYTILEEVGRGGMATVYKGQQNSINRIVAVKVLPPHFLHDPGFLERFEREVEVIAKLEHPHILPIYDYGESDGIPFIVMRFLGGGSMAEMVRKGPPKLDDLEKPFSQIAQALDYAHRQGIIHRDLKPGNIMMDEHGNAYLSDFGIARVMGSDLTGSAIIGTPAYMSPEQAQGLSIDGRSDIYALGVVLFELITGREPYQAETPMGLLLKHINETIPPIRSFRSDVPPSVEEVVNKSTEKDPDGRYASANEMAKAYSQALVTPEATTRPAPPAPDTYAAAPAVPAEQTTPPPTPPGTLPQAAIDPATGAVIGSATGPITGTMPPRRGVSPVLIIGLVAIVAIIVIGAVLILPTLTPPKPILATNLMPTAFPRASTINENQYSISIPDNWIPPQLFLDQSTNNRLKHVWQADDQSAFISLSLVDAELNGDAIFFQAAIDDYDKDYYQAQASEIRLIDDATAEDGTLRRSYRLEADGADAQPYGQLDVFYLERNEYLVVLEMFTADSTANTLVSRLQLILDSLRVHGDV